MTDTTRLSQSPPPRLSMNYAALRENGMELIRQYAGESWTDHNVHDPGITLLEAFCYAITELGFRIQQDIPDLLRSSERYTLANLPPAYQMLPSAPVTVEDLRQILLDHPDIREAQITLDTAGEVDFYEAPDIALNSEESPSVEAPCPFLYHVESGDTVKRVVLKGLYNVMVVFQEPDWNSNVYIPLSVEEETSAPPSYEIALPYWDDPEVMPFRTGIVDSINAVTMQSLGSGFWRALDEPQSYFGNLQISYGNDTTLTLWVVLRIADSLAPSSSETSDILGDAKDALEMVGDNSLIQQFAERLQASYAAALQVQQYIDIWRNLGEVPVRLQVARQQEIGIRARIEVANSTDLEQLLANIFVAIDLVLSPPIMFSSLEELRQRGETPETLFDGPLLRHGFLAETENIPLTRSGKIYTSDILRLIMQLRDGSGGDLIAQENPTGRDIVAVSDLALSNFINNRSITINAQDCLTLVDMQRYRPRLSLAKSRITFVRNNLDIPYDPGRVQNLIEKLQQPQDTPDQAQLFPPVWPVPLGDLLPIDDYFPLQNDLPRIYGVGEAGTPTSAGKVGQSRTLQTKGYLLLFEQFLADLAAQLGHINNFFSASPQEQSTYFAHALFDVLGTEKLLKGFSGERDDAWRSYIADLNNPYRQALQAAAESSSQFLDRRNRMFDHLLARQGETMITWAQELRRWGQKDLIESLAEISLTTDVLQKAMEQRRQDINARLIQDKANFLATAPDLNASRLQALGHPLRWSRELLQMEQVNNGFRWQWILNNEVRLQSVAETQVEAFFEAEAVAVLAVQSDLYRVVEGEDERYRYQLTTTIDSADEGVRILGESLQTWTNSNEAAMALTRTVELFSMLRLETSFTSMERRIAHLTGIRNQERRRLINPLYAVDPTVTGEDTEDGLDAGGYFQIYDESDNDSVIEKRWRLWALPDRSGEVLLSSVFHFEATDNSQAIANAYASIQQVIRYGMDKWNYYVSPAGETTVNFELRHPNFDYLPTDSEPEALALYNPPMASEAEAQAAIRKTLKHLYTLYSAEGFHLVEHILLRPRLSGNGYELVFLSLENIDDLPQAGQSQVIVARVDGSYHVRIFDETEARVVDTANNELNDDFLPDEILLQQLEAAFNNPPLDHQARATLLQRIASSAGYIIADYFLELPSEQSKTGWDQDPYSQQLSFIFPSGYGRDFLTEASEPVVQRDVPPHRFRDREFRRHVERVVQQSCPAHLQPHIYWVDRQDPQPVQPITFAPLIPETATDISFDQFESIYFTWLNTQLIPGISTNEQVIARNQMILAMNALFYSSTSSTL